MGKPWKQWKTTDSARQVVVPEDIPSGAWGDPARGPVLLMLSGGLDSATALYHCLRAGNTAYIHHVTLGEQRATQESKAVHQVSAWLRAQGLTAFETSGSSLIYGGDEAPGLTDPIALSLFIGAALECHPEIDPGPLAIPRHRTAARVRGR